MPHLLRTADRLSAALGALAAALFAAVGAILCYEVTLRYVFNAPTIWGGEVAQILFAAAVFFSLGDVLRRGRHISVGVFQARLGGGARVAAGVFALAAVAVFAAAVGYWGGRIAFESFIAGRSSGSMLNLPVWWQEAALPVGFAALLVQALAEAARLLRGGAPRHFDSNPDSHP